MQLKEGSYVATTLIQFRMLLDKTLSEKAIIGRHFNPNLLLKAFKIYNNNPVFQPNKFKYKKYNLQAFLFWQQVIGYIQRFMPANYVQALCDGAPSTLQCLQKDEPQNRLFNFIIYYAEKNKGIDSQFYPLSSSRLGFDFALYPIGGGNMEPEGLAADCNPNWADVSYGLPEYIQQKEKDMRNLINTKPSQTLSKRFK